MLKTRQNDSQFLTANKNESDAFFVKFLSFHVAGACHLQTHFLIPLILFLLLFEPKRIQTICFDFFYEDGHELTLVGS